MNKVIPILIGIAIVAIVAGVYFISFENDLPPTEEIVALPEEIDAPPEQKGDDFAVELDEGLGMASP